MKNKKLLYILIGLLFAIVGIVIIVCAFPMNVKNITIHTERDSFASTYFDEKIVNIIADSELPEYKVEFGNKDEFEYNINDESIEIIKYVGNDSNVIIPEKFEITVKEKTESNVENEIVTEDVENVKEYNVTAINLEEFNTNIDSLFIPKNVDEIKGNIKTDKDTSFIQSITSVIISTIIYVIVIIITSNKNLEENFYNSLIFIFSMIYLLYSIVNFYLMRAIGISLVTFVIVTLVYVIIIVLLRFYTNRLLNNTDR